MNNELLLPICPNGCASKLNQTILVVAEGPLRKCLSCGLLISSCSKEHYELSRKIGEETLFPEIRKADPAMTIVACGFSCRHQIEHFTGRKAVHWVEAISVDGGSA